MRLAEIIELRPVPAAGLLATLTRRCPLSCAHCSTSSGPRGEDTPAAALRRFVGGFTAGDRPEVLMLTGGEPLLRPALVGDLAELAASAGTRTSVLSGMFFATEGPVPDRIMRALRHVAHFSASIDVFHEREVPRAASFRAVHHIMDSGIDVSFHVVGNSVDDPYLADITASIRAEFRDQAAVLVNHVRQVGRAAGWAAARTVPLRGAGEQALEWARDGAGEGAAAEGWPAPCAMAAWPVVAFDGTVAACCNQRVVDARPLPEHLRLGHIAVDDWPRIRRRCQESPVLRTIRTAGVGSCASCRTLARRPVALAAAERTGSRPAAGAMDELGARLQRDAGAAALLRRYGSERYAPLVMLDGRESGRETGCATGRDAGCGTGRDVGPETGRDAGCGTGRDVGPETGREAGCGTGREAGCGSSRDAGPGTGREAGCETSRDAGGEPGRETGDEPSRRAGSADTHAPACGRQGGREGGRESGRESGREYEEGGGPA
ncbi:radical SAM protein [Streptomyces bobili]|uniref:radical SAM protein n=1 Tax=Streptomyces bobili TaxID=67280 RepID=UPI002B1E8275|nr:radical SAM protein [Streptomyces bobili]